MPEYNQFPQGQPVYAQPAPFAPRRLLTKGGEVALIFGVICLFLGALAGIVLLVFPAPLAELYGGPAEVVAHMHNWVVVAFTFLPILFRTALYGVLGLFLMTKSKTWAGGPFPGTALALFGLLGLLSGGLFAFIPNMILARYGASMIAAYSILSNGVSLVCGSLQTLGSLLIFACCCCALGRAKP